MSLVVILVLLVLCHQWMSKGDNPKQTIWNGRVLELFASHTYTYEKWESENLTEMSWLLNSMQPQINRGFLLLQIAKDNGILLHRPTHR